MKCWKTWIKAAGVRAIKTIAQTAVGMLSGEMLGIMDADWLAVLSVSAMAGVVSLLTSLTGLPECKYEEEMEETSDDEGAGTDDV
ncbi:MAG: holin [Aristaeellaceae bacterium]